MDLNCSSCADSDGCYDNTSSVVETVNSLDPIHLVKRLQPLINAETKLKLELYINCVAFMVTSLIGIAANIVNLIVYWKQGLKDSITLGFFALSISDLLLVLMTFCTSVLYITKLTLPDSDIDLQSVHYVSSATFRNLCYALSSDLTAFLSVERCCCVIIPFKVKVIFSRTRSAVIILVITSFHCLNFLPLFATHKLRWLPKVTVGLNGTVGLRSVLRVFLLPHRKNIEKVNTVLSGIITPTLSQAIVTVCIIILIHGLRASSKFRKSVASSVVSVRNTLTSSDDVQKPGSGVTDKHNDTQMNAKNQLNNRDARLVKTMILLVIIFSISNVPLLIITYTKHFVPEFNFRRAYHNTATVTYSVIYLLSSINATANVFVYYKTSSRFKEITKTLFSCKSGNS